MTSEIKTSTEATKGKIPLWVLVIFFTTLIVGVSSFAITQYQQKQIQKTSQAQRTKVQELQQSILQQDDVINTNWFRTLNPLVQDVTGNILWSSQLQQGILKLYNLPTIEDNQTYHLWIYDLRGKNNAPISSLTFKTKYQNLIVPFSTKSVVDSPFKFELVLDEEGKENGMSLLLAQP